LQNCAEQIFEIVVGVIIAKLERGDILNYERVLFFKTGERRSLKYRQEFVSRRRREHLI